MRAAGAPASSRVPVVANILRLAFRARGENRTRHRTITNRVLRHLSFAGGRGGPSGSRTHYPSIKSRELILMSFRPFRLWRDYNGNLRLLTNAATQNF